MADFLYIIFLIFTYKQRFFFFRCRHFSEFFKPDFAVLPDSQGTDGAIPEICVYLCQYLPLPMLKLQGKRSGRNQQMHDSAAPLVGPEFNFLRKLYAAKSGPAISSQRLRTSTCMIPFFPRIFLTNGRIFFATAIGS